jgi:hypothetical protein
MKRIFLAVSMVTLFAAGAAAQDISGGIKAGLNLANMNGDDTTLVAMPRSLSLKLFLYNLSYFSMQLVRRALRVVMMLTTSLTMCLFL